MSILRDAAKWQAHLRSRKARKKSKAVSKGRSITVRVEASANHPVTGEEMQEVFNALSDWLDSQSQTRTLALYEAGRKMFKRPWVDPDE